MSFTRKQVEDAVKRKGYVWFDSKKDYDVNIVGIRNSSTGKVVTNKFDDWITVSYKIGGTWMYHIWPFTTDPGLTHTVKKLFNPAGVSRMVPGQYRGAYILGMHKNQYSALVQRGAPVKVYRDDNMDTTFDEKKISEGYFGINIHRSSTTGITQLVNDWSAGCQVFQNINDYNQFMNICRKAQAVSKKYTYTLIESKDIT